ncbi:MAG: glycosyltransferase family 8 protein [bacterium]
MEAVHIVFAVDNGYVQHLAVAISSILENRSMSYAIVFHVLEKDISSVNKEKLKLWLSAYQQAEIAFHRLSAEKLTGFLIKERWGLETYFRLFIAEVLDADIAKAVYLDADLIVKQDIKQLWDCCLNGVAIAAVPELVLDADYDLERRRRLGLNEKMQYFNAGVLLLNLDVWRENKLTQKIADYIRDNVDRLKFCDQDALNAVLQNNYLPLPANWNVQSCIFKSYYSLARSRLLQEIRAAAENPSIEHFTGTKPWLPGCAEPYQKEYFYYLSKTPWSDFKIKFVPSKALKKYWRILCRKALNIFLSRGE